MKKQLPNCLKAAWLAATIIVLFVGTSLCATSDEACLQSTETTSLLLLVLSFPTGPIFVYVAIIFLEQPFASYPAVYYFIWLVLAFGGFIQWLVAVPLMFRKKELTVLNLQSATFANLEAGPSANLKTEPPAVTNVILAEPAKLKPKRKRAIRAFDAHGRTPFERVIARNSTNASA